MEITGYKIKFVLEQLRKKRDLLATEFEDSIWKFPAEDKRSSERIASELEEAEIRLASLQVAQAVYNSRVRIEVEDHGEQSLLYCIKIVGGAARMERRWSDAAKNDGKGKKRSWMMDTTSVSRDPNQVYAERSLTTAVCSARATTSARHAHAFRTAIAEGNTRTVEVSIDPALFEFAE